MVKSEGEEVFDCGVECSVGWSVNRMAELVVRVGNVTLTSPRTPFCRWSWASFLKRWKPPLCGGRCEPGADGVGDERLGLQPGAEDGRPAHQGAQRK